ncbi:hypothetical protein JW949_00120 [Candidatus Woesearchaeota archaeon]|nr:hypothetical protein [Candidatus Woesearchaeota archaeon]
MDWIFPVAERWYELIDNGIKEVEGRVPDVSKPSKNYSNIKALDIAVFYAVDENYKKIENLPEINFFIDYNRKYASVQEMLDSEYLDRVLPGVNSVEEGIKIYHSFPGYKERIKKNGIYAIGLKGRAF